MVVLLPNEIWLQIASLLPDSELWAFSTLNSAFLSLALDKRYRSLTIASNFIGSGNYNQHILHCCTPLIVEHVKELVFCPLAHNPHRGKRKWKRPFQAIKRSVEGRPDAVQTTMESVSHLTNISSITIECSNAYNLGMFKKLTPVILSRWEPSRNTLTSLTLSIPLERLSTLVPTYLITFPHLESISIAFFTLRHSHTPHDILVEALNSAVLPFINQHGLSLRALKVELRTVKFDLTPFLAGMEFLPNLQSLSFPVTQAMQPRTIQTFLQSSSESLRNLEISFAFFIPDSNSFATICRYLKDIEISLPHIQNLTIDFNDHPGTFGQLATLAQMFQSSDNLISLKLMRKSLIGTEVSSFLDPASKVPGFTGLRHLHIGISNFTPQVIDLLAARLPNLCELAVCVLSLRSETVDQHSVGHHMFCVEMEERNYPSWKLEHLTLVQLAIQESEIWTEPFCITAIIRALSSLKTFNGIPRREFLADGVNMRELANYIGSNS